MSNAALQAKPGGGWLTRLSDIFHLHPRFLLLLRQSMWVALWVGFCVWLQMNRALGIAVATLVAVVIVLFEILLQIRTRAAQTIPQR